MTNEHLAQAGLGVRIDHRSYKEQGIELSPGRKLGVGTGASGGRAAAVIPRRWIEEQQRIAGANGVQIIADPGIALKAMTQAKRPFRITISRGSCTRGRMGRSSSIGRF